MWARAVRSVSVSVSAAGVALCEGAPKRRLSTPPPRRRVTPVVDLERDVIVLERQIAGEPLTRVTLSAMVDDMADPDRKLLLFGEQHDDAVAQDVQRAVYDDLTRRRTEKLALALEFIDADARDAARAFSDGSSDDVDALFHGAGDARKYGPFALQARATGTSSSPRTRRGGTRDWAGRRRGRPAPPAGGGAMAPLSVRTLFCSATDTHDFFCNGIDEELGRHNSPVDHTNGQHVSYSAHVLDIEPSRAAPSASEPGCKLTVCPPVPSDLVTVTASLYEKPAPPVKKQEEIQLDEIRDRGIANQEKVFRVAATVAYCLLFLSLVLIGSGIPYAVVGSQMGTAFRYLGKSCNVTDLDYRGSELSLFDSSERYDTWKYTVATRSLDDVPTTYASEVIRVERPGGDRHSKIRAGDVRKCWAPRGGDRRNDLPGILWHGFNCGNKYCLKLEQPAREAAYVRDLGIYFVCFGVIGVVLGCMFDGVAAEALQARTRSNATSKNQVRWLRPSVAFRKSSISHRQAWQKH
ncbi:hypothetical protein JL720_11977 [Aureococcus anophagefferens]|nr:hypothetical protein JL720_11977 [Aureococcus anophagefferens]